MVDRAPPPVVRQKANRWVENDPWLIRIRQANMVYDNSIILLQYYIRRWLVNRARRTGEQA